jgi:hypothetical protein
VKKKIFVNDYPIEVDADKADEICKLLASKDLEVDDVEGEWYTNVGI